MRQCERNSSALVLALEKPGIGWDPVTFAEHDEISPNDLTARYPLAFTIAYDQGARAGEVAQCFKDALGTRLRDDGYADRRRAKYSAR